MARKESKAGNKKRIQGMQEKTPRQASKDSKADKQRLKSRQANRQMQARNGSKAGKERLKERQARKEVGLEKKEVRLKRKQ